jgi:CMP/dCMP kinase
MDKDISKITIAIDGHSSCGKSTIAKEIARRFGLTYIDTGAMYRAVTLFSLRTGLVKHGEVDAEGLMARIEEVQVRLKKNTDNSNIETWLNGECVDDQIRSLEVSNNVSAVSALPFVRHRMVQLQQVMGQFGGVVLDGRDIGTVVFPNADLKLFMTASTHIRAKRRYDEMIQKGDSATFDEVLANVESRDHLDSTRTASPLKKADDAIELDNSFLDRDEQIAWVIAKLQEQGWVK